MSRPRPATTFHNAIFIGLETFLVEEELSRIKRQLGENASMNWSAFNTEEGLDLNEILGLCNTLPFLSEKRGIVIRNGHRLTAKLMDQLISYLDNPSESTIFILVLEPEKADKELNRLLKRFEGKAEVVRFEPIRNRAERIRWITDRALVHGKKMDRDAAVLLADLAGNSMWSLDSEIAKLSLYAAAKPAIATEDIQELVVRTHEISVFTFLDALFDRKKEAFFRLYEIDLMGIPELEFISLLESQVISHYVVLSGGDWKKMRIHDFIADKALKRKSLWNPSQLAALLGDVRRIEQKIKSGSLMHVYAALTEVIGRYVLPPRNEGGVAGRP
jgi:DNA polymerase-3 subunit delta